METFFIYNNTRANKYSHTNKIGRMQYVPTKTKKSVNFVNFSHKKSILLHLVCKIIYTFANSRLQNKIFEE